MAKDSGGSRSSASIGRLQRQVNDLTRQVNTYDFLLSPDQLAKKREQLQRAYQRLYRLTDGFTRG